MVYALEGGHEHFRLSEGAEMMSQRGRERRGEGEMVYAKAGGWGSNFKFVCKVPKVCCIGVSLYKVQQKE